MINIKREEVASWAFNRSNKEVVPGESLLVLNKVLSIFGKNRLFETTKITVSRSHLSKGELNIHMRHPKYDSQYVIEEIESISKAVESLGTIYLDGLSSLLLNEKESIGIEGVFRISFSMKTCELHVTTFSDLWVPFDLEGRPQLELAELNGKRLEEALECIANNLNYEEMYPSKEEAVWDQRLGQKGFKLFINEEIINEKDFPKDKYDVVQKYFWKNRDN